jgi:hypothetical protein
MKPYRTLASVRLFTGIVGLTDEQVKWRANCLKKIADSTYEIINEVVFKAGEVIGLEDPPKPYRKALECLEPEKPAVEVDIKETVEVDAKPVAKKRKYVKRKE